MVGPGLVDMTRLAMSSFAIWGDVLATNRDAIGSAVDRYIQELRDLRDALNRGDGQALRAMFERAQQFAEKIRTENSRSGCSLSCG